MQDLNVCLVQCEQHWEDIEKNIKHYDHLLSSVEKDTDLILLPEMFQTSFTMNIGLAEDWTKSSSISWLRNKAKNLDAAIYSSLLIREGEQTYNRGVFVLPNGEIHIYNKRKCFGLAGEDEVIEAGKENTLIKYKGWNLQLHICYDLRFPEIMRNSPTPHYDVLLFVANWPKKRITHWSQLLRARAIENQSYVLAANRVGVDGLGFEYNGQSAAINALGEELSETHDKEELIYAKLSMEHLRDLRTSLPFLKDQ